MTRLNMRGVFFYIKFDLMGITDPATKYYFWSSYKKSIIRSRLMTLLIHFSHGSHINAKLTVKVGLTSSSGQIFYLYFLIRKRLNVPMVLFLGNFKPNFNITSKLSQFLTFCYLKPSSQSLIVLKQLNSSIIRISSDIPEGYMMISLRKHHQNENKWHFIRAH